MKSIIQTITYLMAIVITCSCCGPRHHNGYFYYEQTSQALLAGNVPEAMQHLDKAISYDPAPHYKALKTTLLYQTHRFQECKQLCEKLLKEKHSSPHLKTELLNNYAAALYQLGQRKQAEVLWTQLAHNPNYTTQEVAWFNLGMLSWLDYEKSQKKNINAAKKSNSYFTKAVKKEPDYVDALFYRAQTELTLNQDLQAYRSLKKVMNLAPSHQLARVLLQQHQKRFKPFAVARGH